MMGTLAIVYDLILYDFPIIHQLRARHFSSNAALNRQQKNLREQLK